MTACYMFVITFFSLRMREHGELIRNSDYHRRLERYTKSA